MITILLYNNNIYEMNHMIEKINEIRNMYSFEELKVILLNKVYDKNANTPIMTKTTESNILVYTFRYNNKYVYSLMKEYEYPFYSHIHKLCNYNIVSLYSNLLLTNIIRLENEMSDKIIYSRIDTFFQNPAMIDHSLKHTIYGLLRHDNNFEDRYIITNRYIFGIICDEMNNFLKFASKKELEISDNNYPEKLLYLFFKDKLPTECEIMSYETKILPNMSKYSYNEFMKQLESYISYLRENDQYFVIHMNDKYLFDIYNNTFPQIDDYDMIRFNTFFDSENIKIDYEKIKIITDRYILLKNGNTFSYVLTCDTDNYMSCAKIKYDFEPITVKSNTPFRIYNPQTRTIINSTNNKITINNHFNNIEIQIKGTGGSEIIIELEKPDNFPSLEEGNKNAILLIGFDRFTSETKNDLYTIIRNLKADVFVMTYEHNFFGIENDLCDNVKYIERQSLRNHTSYIRSLLEDNDYHNIKDNTINIFCQFNNVYNSFLKMTEYEHAIGEKYKYVFKFRSDIKIGNLCFTPDFFIKKGIIYMASDYIYYGTREVMKIVCNLFNAKFDYYDKVPFDRRSINYDILLKSIENNRDDSFEFERSVLRNKLLTIPIAHMPHCGDFSLKHNIKQYMVNVCNHMINYPENNNKMVPLNEYDVVSKLFQCEYMIVDWMIKNRVYVYEPSYFTLMYKV